MAFNLMEPIKTKSLQESIEVTLDSLLRLCYRCFEIMVSSPKEYTRARFVYLATNYPQNFLGQILYHNLIKAETAAESDNYFVTTQMCQNLGILVSKILGDLNNLCEATKAGDLFEAARWRDELRFYDVHTLKDNFLNA